MTDEKGVQTNPDLAYREAHLAKEHLSMAARYLGYDSTHELAQALEDESNTDAKAAITNAFSYLDSVDLTGLKDDD